MAQCVWSHIRILIINLIVIGLTLAERKCHNGLLTPGYTDPYGDINIEYGGSFNITCVLSDQYIKEHGDYPSTNLYFMRDTEIVPSEMIEVLDSSRIRLHIEKPPKSSSVYTCKLKNDTNAVCLNNVVVGTKPLPIDDFECYGLNYDNLTCTWTAPENYAKTTYNLTYYFPGRAGRNMLKVCPKVEPLPGHRNSRKLRCLWTIQTDPQYRQVQRTYYYELNVSNYFGSYQLNYTFSHFQHVLSGPPENLTKVSSTTESIYLQWSVPLSMQGFPPGLQHRVLYQSQFEKQWQFAGSFKTTTPDEMKHVHFNMTGLKYAHALYDIRVSMRSDAADPDDESMWSKNTSNTFWTDSKVPGAPPMTNIGSFEVVSSGNTLNQRQVFVYWQQIPLQITNGENFTYVVEVEGNSEIRPVEVTHAYAKFRNLSIDESYAFHIWSQNSIGRSREKSIVSVPSQLERIGEPLLFTKIAFGDGKYELSWEPPKRNLFYFPPVKNYTIFWCTHDRDRPYQCTGHLSWIEIPNNKKIYNITVSDDTIIHQFAISANTHTSSSGMAWAACTVIHNQAIGKMKNVQITHVDSTVIQVSWKLDCSDRVGSVEGFVIYYCSIVQPSVTNCKGSEQSLIVNDTTAEQANITGLKPYETYMLAVSVITKHNSHSQKSDYQFATTLEGAPDAPFDLQIINVTNTSISISWRKPKFTNGKLKYYHILCNNISETVEAEFEEYTMNNLNSYMVYNISVLACTVLCSEASSQLVRTHVGYPGKTNRPGVTFQNNSYILVEWDQPRFPRGNNDIFEISFKEKLQYENRTHAVVNVTGTKYAIEDCGADGKYNTFYVSIRAVNIFNGTRYEGPWSDELESFCQASENVLIWILVPLTFVFVTVMFYLGKRMYFHYREMRNVEVKLPPGLANVGPMDMGLTHRGMPKIQDDQSRPPSADEELLLVKRSDSQNLSGDSSGCSSGHESVTSSLESATHLSNSSDSGTEQHRSSSTEELRKNSLRLRSVAASRPVTKGYVTMPVDNANSTVWNPKNAPGSYCTLDQAPVSTINPSYVPAPLSQIETPKMPYLLPDASNESTPYVLVEDFNKPCNSGYVPLNSPELLEKNPSYVMAGNKGIVMPDLVRLDSYKSTDSSEDKPLYVQVAEPPRMAVPDSFSWHQPSVGEVSPTTGYVTIGDAPAPRICSDSSKVGYIPHRHFDVKTIKED